MAADTARDDHAQHARERLLRDPYWSGVLEELVLTGWLDHLTTRRAHELGWTPPISHEELDRMAREYDADV